MLIEYDEAKRARTLMERGLDFDDAGEVFTGIVFDRVDDRRNYGEVRIATLGALRGVPVLIVWTARGNARRIIPMRLANGNEREIYWRAVDRSR